MFALRQWDNIPAMYQAVSQFDANTGFWISENLQERLAGSEKYRKPLSCLFSSTILGDYPVDVKTIATSNLASILEGLLRSQKTHVVSGLSLPCEDLANSFRRETQTWNRPATDAALRFQGCLLAIRVIETTNESIRPFTPDICNWAVTLRSALEEETVR